MKHYRDGPFAHSLLPHSQTPTPLWQAAGPQCASGKRRMSAPGPIGGGASSGHRDQPWPSTSPLTSKPTAQHRPTATRPPSVPSCGPTPTRSSGWLKTGPRKPAQQTAFSAAPASARRPQAGPEAWRHGPVLLRGRGLLEHVRPAPDDFTTPHSSRAAGFSRPLRPAPGPPPSVAPAMSLGPHAGVYGRAPQASAASSPRYRGPRASLATRSPPHKDRFRPRSIGPAGEQVQ